MNTHTLKESLIVCHTCRLRNMAKYMHLPYISYAEMLSRYPIIGDRWQCLDCPERVGFDLCAACYEKRADVVGRFNQHHKAGVVACPPVHPVPAQKQATYTHFSKLCMLQHMCHADSRTQATEKVMCICRSQDEAGAHHPKLPARAPGMPAVSCSIRPSPSASHPVAVGRCRGAKFSNS